MGGVGVFGVRREDPMRIGGRCHSPRSAEVTSKGLMRKGRRPQKAPSYFQSILDFVLSRKAFTNTKTDSLQKAHAVETSRRSTPSSPEEQVPRFNGACHNRMGPFNIKTPPAPAHAIAFPWHSCCRSAARAPRAQDCSHKTLCDLVRRQLLGR